MSQHSFWAERLFVNKQLSIHIYEKDGKLAECVGIKECDEDPFLSDPSLYERIREKQRIKGEPVVITDDGWVAYIAFEDRNGRIGAFRDRLDYSDTERQNGRRKLHLTNEIGKLAEDGLKQMEYMVAVGLTLASRAAIEGGVSPSQAYAVSDVFFQKLEKCRTQVEMFKLHAEIERVYVAMVHQQKKRKRVLAAWNSVRII